MPPALVMAPGIRVADWEKFSAKGGNRVPHRSPKASDRWHPQFDFEEIGIVASGRPPAEEPVRFRAGIYSSVSDLVTRRFAHFFA